MSTRIGGPYRCNIHPDFPETEDDQVWKQHLQEYEEHTQSGGVQCEVCGVNINFENIPDNGAPPKLKCPKCYEQQEQVQQLVLNSYKENNNGGELSQ
jgi:hypothetical protein